MNKFLEDVLAGLSAGEKYLQSKYFYDAKGDRLFQQIMGCREYYLTKCEMEIFTEKTAEIVALLGKQGQEFDIVELGAGDATKSIHLLKGLLENNFHFTYFPVDISGNVINSLHHDLPQKLPGLKLKGLHGEYFQMLQEAKALSQKIKVVLFLGSNIGNVPFEKAGEFCQALRKHLQKDDLVLIGFDLKKDPLTILNAYNDSAGFTRDFNLNLLARINAELKGNFDLSAFYHYPAYDPATGACRSFLVSKKEQTVSVSGTVFKFKQGEPIAMEISQKYTKQQTDEIAHQNGFVPIHHFFDSNEWFVDAVWRCA